MQIHVVQPNETLASIAEAFHTKPESVISANNIPYPYKLVVGQALVIPIDGSYYWVAPGDNIYSIAKKAGISYEELMKLNNLSAGEALKPGTKLYLPPKAKTDAQFNAYIESYGQSVSPSFVSSAKEAAPYLTYLAPFSFQVLRNGTLKPPLLDDYGTIAKENKTLLMMAVTNLENGKFSADLGKTILTSPDLQNTLLNNIADEANKMGFQEVHFDFEFLPPEEKNNYLRFLTKAKAKLGQAGFLISAALAPKTSANQKGYWYEAHDYKEIGEIVDFVVIMTYEWGYSGGPPEAVSPLNEVTKVIDYAISVIPPNKIFLGQNLYGYDWTLPYVPGGPYAKAVSPQQAVNLARSRAVPILFDDTAMAPHFEYTDENNKKHVVWFEDARSIQAKFELVKNQNLRGVSYWKLGLKFPQNWLLIEENFNVIKR